MKNIAGKLLAAVLGFLLWVPATSSAQTIKTFCGPVICSSSGDCVRANLGLTGINNNGQLSGAWDLSGDAENQGQVQSVVVDSATGNMTNIPLPKSIEKGGRMRIHKINNNGDLAGIGDFLNGKGNGPGKYDGFGVISRNSGFMTFQVKNTNTAAYATNDFGDVVGTYFESELTHGFYNPVKGGGYQVIDFPGSSYTVVTDINNQKDIIGYTRPGDGVHEISGFLKQGYTFTQLDFPQAVRTFLLGINNHGDIVGYYTLAADDFAPQHGFTYINGVFSSMDIGKQYTNFYDINDVGEIVGYADIDGIDSCSSFTSFLLSPAE